MDSTKYVILERLPTPKEYRDLRELALLTPPPLEALAESIPKGLANSFACFVAFERKLLLDGNTPAANQPVIAMGRLLGDGALFLQLCDLAVHPDHQGQGIGKAIMRKLVDYIDEHAPHAYVSMVADPLGQGLYPRFGFEDVKPGIGMYRCVWRQNDPEFQRVREEKIAAKLRGPS